MYEKLDDVQLKSGETLEVGVVLAPDEQFSADIQTLLGHKGGDWQTHIQSALEGKTDTLETRFYIGLLDGQPVGNIMTVEQYGVGILGHVFTRPEHRRKGICQAIMTEQMEDFRQREGHVLTLGTGFESAAYWIYHSFGFRSLKGGFMRYSTQPFEEFEAHWFDPSSVKVVSPEWKHWSLVALLASVPGKEYLRSAAWQLYGIGCMEGPYVGFMAGQKKNANVRGAVLEAEDGAVVGCATLTPVSGWVDVWQLDVFTHPAFSEHMPELIQGVPMPDSPVIAYCDTESSEKIAALAKCDFDEKTKLAGFLKTDNTSRDIILFGKDVD